jgi:acyl carrier protein
MKDIIFINGQNLYPSDIEHAAGKAGALPPGSVAVVGVHSETKGRDVIVGFVAFEGDLVDFLPLERQLRNLVAQHVGVRFDAVVPVAALPKTDSGKIRRRQLAGLYAEGRYDGIIEEAQFLKEMGAKISFREESAAEAEALILQAFNEILPPACAIGPDTHFIEAGADSMALSRVAARLDDAFPGRFSVADLFSRHTVRDLAAHLAKSGAVALPAVIVGKKYLADRDCPEAARLYEMKLPLGKDVEKGGGEGGAPAADPDLVTGMLFQGLGEMSESPQFSMHAATGRDGWVTSHISAAGRVVRNEVFRLADLRKASFRKNRKNKCAVSAIVFDKSLYSDGLGLLDWYDAVFECERSANQAWIRCYYNERVLKSVFMEELMENIAVC